jgi:hypothetical protein
MSGLAADDENMPVVLSRVYEKLMAEIDAIDNGFAAYDAGVKPKYDVGGSIGHRSPSQPRICNRKPLTPHHPQSGACQYPQAGVVCAL